STANTSGLAQNTAVTAGSAVTGGLGVAALVVEPTAHIEHSKNMLADVWNGPAESTAYPSFVWAYLSRPEFSNTQEASIRENIVARWRHLGVLEGRSPREIALFFGAGGDYDADQLRTHAAMLDQVLAEVHLEHQELRGVADHLLL